LFDNGDEPVTETAVEAMASDSAAAVELISPRSLVVVGASERSRWSNAILGNLALHDFGGVVHLVNVRGSAVGGRPTAPSCRELGARVDLGVVLVPAAAVVEAVRDLAHTGARSAMILTSGFAETGAAGADLQAAVAAAAAEADIRLLGPNSLGFMNFVGRTVAWAAPTDARPSSHGVAIVSQSGATGYFLTRMAAQEDVALSYVVSTGNEADLDCSTFASALAADPHTTAVAMFVESVRHPDRFVAAAEAAAAANKPLVVLKVGTSESSARAAMAHTGALVGDDRVFDGICQQNGIIRVRSLEQLVTTADVVGRTGVLGTGGLCLVSNSGGVCEIGADSAHALDIDLPPVPASAVSQLRDELPSFATPHNPLDLTGGIVPEACGRIVTTLADSPEYAAVLVPFYPVLPTADAEDQRLTDLHHHLGRALRQSSKPAFLVTYTNSTVSDAARQRIDAADLPYLACGMDRALVALAHAFRWSRFQRLHHRRRRSRAPGEAIVEHPRSELAMLDLLGQHGIPTIPHVLAVDEGQAVAAAAGWGGPVAVKVASESIGHKTEIGGVVLGVSGADDVASAFRHVVAAGAAQPDAVIDGAIVSPMRGRGVELFVGCSRDPVWGPVIAVGLGGVWVEVLADVAIRPLPVRSDDVQEMLGGLRAARLLAGERDLPVADLDAVGAVVEAIGDVALRLGDDLVALDVNPLWVCGQQVEVLDSLAEWAS
jgi:acyl-CoA synthetase (NDP forming)